MKLEKLQKLINEAAEKCGKTTTVSVADKDGYETWGVEGVIYNFESKEISLLIDN
jgi:16S rRNA U1498 N3-methylase RsmE